MQPQPIPQDAHAVVAVSCYPTLTHVDGYPQAEVAIKVSSVPFFHVSIPEFAASSEAYFVMPAGSVHSLVDALLDAHDRAEMLAEDTTTSVGDNHAD
jgi:hypothetical protein